MDIPQPIDSRLLLDHAAWVQRLARSLVGDPNQADDLAQETWLAALENPPRDNSNPRGWLATVLTNLVRQKARGETRRRAREHSAARHEAQPATLDVLARASMHRELVEAVMSLREPFRTAVLLRFFDDMPPRKIAAQLEIPVHTVNSRLQRGLTELRSVLDERRGGDRKAWIVALLPLAQQGGDATSWASPTIGALVMNAKWKLAVALVLAVVGVLGVREALDVEPPAPTFVSAVAPKADEEPLVHAPLESALAVEQPATERASAAVPVEAPAVKVAASAARTLRGRVLDADAQPIAGLRLRFRPDSNATPVDAALGEWIEALSKASVATSDRDGSFEMPAPLDAGEIVSADAAFTTVMAGLFRPQASIEPIVVAARVRALGGRVLDANGTPLAGARVRLEIDAAFATRFAHVLDASQEERWQIDTDARGAFAFEHAPWVEGARIVTSLEGFESDVRAAPELVDRALEIVLKPRASDVSGIQGDVVLPDGSPAAGARVAFGGRTLLTSASGRFTFDLAQGDGERIVAVKRGFAPVELAAEESSPRWPSFVRLRLAAPSLSIAGRIVDAAGDPLRRVRVWLADPTYFASVDGTPTQVEHLLAGAGDASEGAAEASRSLFWTWFETDRQGRFRIEGLCPRNYRLKAMDPKTLVQLEHGPVAAGDESVKIEFPTEGHYASVSGRVLAKNGDPIAGAKVNAVRRVFTVKRGSSTSNHGHGGASTTTDADGRFKLERVAREGVLLAVSGDAILSTSFDFPDTPTSTSKTYDGIEIQVVRRCHLQIELAASSARADSYSVLDANGREMSLSVIRGDNDFTTNRAQLIEGRSPVVAVGEDGVTLVLYAEDQEIAREPVALVPGQVRVIRP